MATRGRESILPRLALAVVLSVLAGVCVAGLAFPVIGGAGLIAKSGADEFTTLPADLKTPPLSQRSRILDKNGNLLATLFSENRVPVRLQEVPVFARQALIAIEDNRFYEHNGIDIKGTVRALARNSRSGSVQQGGSTLTQQYVKNALLEAAGANRTNQDAARGRTVKRKLQEARYALALEHSMTKDQILESYLNIAYYGNGVYGIGTAATHYFGRNVSTLDLAQGALLAGMVQNPNRFDPIAHPQAAVLRRNVVLGRLADLGYINPAQKAKGEAEGLHLHPTTVKSGCEAPGVTAPFFCDYVRRYLEDGPARTALGATRQERQQALLGGGLTIKTTLDPVVQSAAQQAVDTQVPKDDPSGALAVSDSVEPGTGAVKAMAVDRPYGDQAKLGQTKVNFALGGTYGFQGGSTFKAFVLARALQLGIPTDLTLYAPQRYCPKAFKYVTPTGCGPQNAGDSEAGVFNMIQATWDSVNTYYIQLEERTGLATPPALAESLGVRVLDPGGDPAGKPFSRTNGSFVLGTEGVSPLAMAGAYATFAAHGLFCPPTPIATITDRDGKKVDLPPNPCSQALEKGVADTVTSILQGVIDGPDPLRTGAHASIGRPAAGKTGTTDTASAAWFDGYTPQLATSVWVGKATPAPLTDISINNNYYKEVYGGTVPAAIWQQMMSQALKDVAPVDFATADPTVTLGAMVDVPDVTGQPVDAAEQALRDAGFAVETGSRTAGAPIPAGAVASTSPSAGSSVPAGTTVQVHPSNGREAPTFQVPTFQAPQPGATFSFPAAPQPTATTPSFTPGPAAPSAAPFTFSPAPQPRPTRPRGRH